LSNSGFRFPIRWRTGRVNQESATRALAAGTTPGGVLDMIGTLRQKTQIPIMCYTYLNPYHAAGYEAMMRRTARAGVDGLLFLDMPVEESAELTALMTKHHINNIALVTPTSPVARIRQIVKVASGFVYCVSRAGVTGMQDKLSAGADELVRTTKKLPVFRWRWVSGFRRRNWRPCRRGPPTRWWSAAPSSINSIKPDRRRRGVAAPPPGWAKWSKR
jgi:tryptophan synthase alpha subunit